MNISYTHIKYNETGYFSKLVNDYLYNNKNLHSLFGFEPDITGINDALQQRLNYKVDRKNLVNTLTKQYAHLPITEKTETNINCLLNDNTFTICTAHQPNLMTGYLYFIYKILHAIKLSDFLNNQYPQYKFVPVYYMGSEDNDLEELGTFRFRNQKFIWEGNGQTGAVGRMNTETLRPILNELFKLFGPTGENCDKLKNIISSGYLEHITIGKATQYIVNELFGKYGLVILNPDERDFKSEFIKIAEDELINQSSYSIVKNQFEVISENYKVQANPRHINLFYLKDNFRERIEIVGNEWIVVNTNLKFTKTEILSELHEHPDRFSPNVILRGLFQESILPNIAFIGGGAEVAYWLQLKPLFQHYNVFYPTILLRQSVLWINKENATLRKKTDLEIQTLFKELLEIEELFILKNSINDLQLSSEKQIIENAFVSIESKSMSVDPTLQKATLATIVKIKNSISKLEKKLLKAEKRKYETQLLRIRKLKSILFPNNSLQERTENFTEYYLEYGLEFFDNILKGIEPLNNNFLVIECS